MTNFIFRTLSATLAGLFLYVLLRGQLTMFMGLLMSIFTATFAVFAALGKSAANRILATFWGYRL
jgi:hypothetical protein